MKEGSSMLKLKNIRKTYEVAGAKFEALKGLNICFRKNENTYKQYIQELFEIHMPSPHFQYI